MILFFIFIIWLLIGNWISRMQRDLDGRRLLESLDLQVETVGGPAVPVRWYFNIPINIFFVLPLVVIYVIFLFLRYVLYSDFCFDWALRFYVQNILGISDGVSVFPFLSAFYPYALFFLFTFISCITIYSVHVIIRSLLPSYYEFNLNKSGKGSIFTRPISYLYLILALIISFVFSYYNLNYYITSVLVASPFIFAIFVAQQVLDFLRSELLLLRAAFKQWLIFGGIVSFGLCMSPIHVLTDKALVVSIFFRTKEINWAEVISLDLKVEQNSSTGISTAGFDEHRFSVKANASNKEDLDIKLYSSDSQDQLKKIVEFFKAKAIPLKCTLDPNLETALNGVDSAKLGNSAREKFELLSYINKICKK